MERLEYENYEEFACDIADEYDSLEDEFGDVAIIAKYNEAKEIIKELLCLGYDVASIDIHKEEFENYYDEYIISFNSEGVWCEKFKRDNGYLDEDSSIYFVMDNCSSTVFKHIDSEEMYEVAVGEGDEDCDNEEIKYNYMVNGKHVNKNTFDEYVSKFDPDLVDVENDISDDDDYSITVKYNVDASEALEVIKDMERRMTRIDNMFREMDCFKWLFNW